MFAGKKHLRKKIKLKNWIYKIKNNAAKGKLQSVGRITGDTIVWDCLPERAKLVFELNDRQIPRRDLIWGVWRRTVTHHSTTTIVTCYPLLQAVDETCPESEYQSFQYNTYSPELYYKLVNKQITLRPSINYVTKK